MKNKSLALAIAILMATAGFSQTTKQTEFSFKKTGVVTLKTTDDDFHPVIRHLEAPQPGTESTRAYQELIKQQIPAKKYDTRKIVAQKKSNPPTPFVLRNFKGNPFRGIPNDNSMAISNDGKIVSTINSTVQVYSAEGELLESMSLATFGSDLELSGNKFDPRVQYDPTADRFVLTYLNGTNAKQSNLTIAFSQTNDPAGDWNLYYLPGNPLSDSSWSDYPMISITENEVFYTINLLNPGGSWQTSFKQTVIWQIDKNAGYKGEELSTKLWSDIGFGGKPIRNLYPIKGGADIYGPNCYFLSTRNFALENDTIFFLEITGEKDDTETELKVDYLISDVAYGMPPNASQKQTNLELQTNDGRILDGFIEKDQIVFASNSVDTSNNFAAVYFGHINNVSTNPSLKGTIYGSDSLEFGYPGLAFTGDDDNFTAIMCVNYSSFNHYPGCGVINYENGELSNYKYVKEGGANINVLGGAERWGDYIGMQPKYNEMGICWMAGTFGKERQGVGTEYGTWIAEIQKYGFNTSQKREINDNRTSIYPNPAKNYNWITVHFKLEESQNLNYSVYNYSGQLIKSIINSGKTKAGRNEFQFDASSLAKGNYLLKIEGSNGFIISEPFVIE